MHVLRIEPHQAACGAASGSYGPIKRPIPEPLSTGCIMRSLIERQPDSLGFREVLERGGAVLPAKTRLARSSPWQPNIGVTVGVDPYRAGLQAGGHAMHPSDIRAPDARRQTIGGPVRDPHRILFVVEGNDRQDGSENLFLRDPHFMLNIREHGGFDEVAAIAHSSAAGHYGG